MNSNDLYQMITVIGFIGLLIAVLIFFSFRNRQYYRQQVKREWGKLPRLREALDNEESLIEAWQVSKAEEKFDSEIDDVTWYDLDMLSVFQMLNGTYSSVGSEALYGMLRNYHFNGKRQANLANLKEYLKNHPAEREKVQYHFAMLGKCDHNYVESFLKETEKQKLPSSWLYSLLACVPIVGLMTMIVSIKVGIVLLVGSIIVNSLVYMSQKGKVEKEFRSLRYLVGIIATGKKVGQFDLPNQTLMQKSVAELKGILKVAFTFQVKSGSDTDIFMEMINGVFLLPFLAYNYTVNLLEKKQEDSKILWRLLGEIEVACGILNFETFMPLVSIPVFHSEKKVVGKETYHPLLSHPVANDVTWQGNTLVTGSNASGKSTYVKSIAINSILAQTLGICCGASFALPHSHVLTSMALEDDIFAGESYFIAEIKSVKRIIDKVATGNICLCFVDEILKGTNTIERIAASGSMIHWLNQRNSLCFVATHDIELTEILGEACHNVHFEEQVSKEEGVTFDYILRAGPAKSRNAIALLKVMDYPKDIVATAEEEAAYFDHTRSWRKM